jgi:ribosomal protein S18 acetylase RimI-like enzyme
MRFLKRLAAFVFQSYFCDLYESTLIERNEADFLPRIRNLTFHIVYTAQRLDELVSAGFDLAHSNTETRSMLEQGAVVGLLFVDRELASMEWAATSEQANRAINIYPLKINFSQKEAYASGVWTNPKFRRNGLHIYVYYKVYDHLRNAGIATIRSIVATDNIAAQKAHDRFAPQEKRYARAHYLRILGLQIWKEELFNRQSTARLLARLPSVPDG